MVKFTANLNLVNSLGLILLAICKICKSTLPCKEISFKYSKDWKEHTITFFIILLGIISNGLWRKLIHWIWWVFKKFFMKIGSSINSKISAELSYTGQRVRVISKATCNIKKVTIERKTICWVLKVISIWTLYNQHRIS